MSDTKSQGDGVPAAVRGCARDLYASWRREGSPANKIGIVIDRESTPRVFEYGAQAILDGFPLGNDWSAFLSAPGPAAATARRLGSERLACALEIGSEGGLLWAWVSVSPSNPDVVKMRVEHMVASEAEPAAPAAPTARASGDNLADTAVAWVAMRAAAGGPQEEHERATAAYRVARSRLTALDLHRWSGMGGAEIRALAEARTIVLAEAALSPGVDPIEPVALAWVAMDAASAMPRGLPYEQASDAYDRARTALSPADLARFDKMTVTAIRALAAVAEARAGLVRAHLVDPLADAAVAWATWRRALASDDPKAEPDKLREAWLHLKRALSPELRRAWDNISSTEVFAMADARIRQLAEAGRA